MRLPSLPLAFILAGAASHLLTPAAQAQTPACERGSVTGVTHTESGIAVPRVEVSLAGMRTVSDSFGTFRLSNVCEGPNIIQARRLGFHSVTWNVDVPAGGVANVEITLAAVAQALEPVVVSASTRGSPERLRGFYVRRQRNAGRFLTREQIEPFDNLRLTDALRSQIPGLSVGGGGRGVGRSTVRLRGQRCAPLVWLDGMPTPAGEFDLDVITPSSVMGIEVYSGVATIPAEFRLPFGRDACGGVIVVWSRIGRDEHDLAKRRQEQLAYATSAAPVYSHRDVDVPAQVDSAWMVMPSYPDSLFAFSVEGKVLAEFVVDTSGLPMINTITILSESNSAFGDAVRRAIMFSRFTPAQKDDRPVRQLMQLPFEFTTPRRR